ncbi:MAG: carbohydrate-binding family 9-like protein [Candidatus Fimadaptatus sp.]
MRGNVYKGGGKTRFEHYGMWNPVTSDHPDFHRPESFGLLVLE